MKLLRDQKTRPFVLDIETDSTIAPDENAQKQRATEFITAVGGFMGQAIPLVQAVPQASKLMAETLKYVARPVPRRPAVGRRDRGIRRRYGADGTAAEAAGPGACQGSGRRSGDTAGMQVEQQRHQREQQAAQMDQQRKDAEAKANQEREQAKYEADMQCKDQDEPARRAS
jgi:hypothetical protein